MNQSTVLVLPISLIIAVTIVILKPLERFNNFSPFMTFHEDSVVNFNALSVPKEIMPNI